MDYILSHSSPEPPYLHALWRAAHIHTLHGHMASGHLQGRLLKMLVRMARPQRVLEVGTFTGYSALCMAEGLPPGGHIWTFEINDEMEAFARKWINGSPLADRITLTIGDANALAPRLGLDFDLAFIDGDKRTYVQTYDMAMRLLRPGGFLLADNTLWDGHVSDPAYDRDPQTRGIRAFNDHVQADPQAEHLIIPLRDGLTVVRKCGEGEL